MTRRRIMNWVWDGWPVRQPWWVGYTIARIACCIWGHHPAPEVCGWCLKHVGARR